MSVQDAIREADALLPGVPVEAGEDPRWQAIIGVGGYVEADPEAVRGVIRRWGGHPQEDLRNAVATCVLEDLLAFHFAAYFPRVEELALADRLFGDTFLRCWRTGQADDPAHSARFDSLVQRLRDDFP